MFVGAFDLSDERMVVGMLASGFTRRMVATATGATENQVCAVVASMRSQYGYASTLSMVVDMYVNGRIPDSLVEWLSLVSKLFFYEVREKEFSYV
jgi:hypothetical protein